MGRCIPGPVVKDVVRLREPGRDLGWLMLCCANISLFQRWNMRLYGEEADVAFCAQFSATTAQLLSRWSVDTSSADGSTAVLSLK